jgi:Tfp pilus assembly protein PilF
LTEPATAASTIPLRVASKPPARRSTIALLFACGAACACASTPRPVSKLVDGRIVVTRAIAPDAYEHVARALLFEEEQRWEEAARELQRALSYDDQAAEVWAQLADLLVRMGELDDAKERIERSFEVEPTVAGYLAWAHLMEARHDDKAALERYRQAAALALSDGDVEAIEDTHLALSNAQLAALDLPGAHATIRTLTDAARDSIRAHIERAALAWAEGHLTEAEAALKEALALEPSEIDGRLMLAALQVATDRPADAKATFREALERTEDSLEVAEMFLKWLVARGDKADAAVEADRLTPDVLDENTVDAIVRIERAAGRPERAKAAAEKAQTKGLSAARASLLVGSALADTKDLTAAAARFLKVRKGEPEFIESRLRAAEVLRRAGGARPLAEADRALEEATAALASEPAAAGNPPAKPTNRPADGKAAVDSGAPGDAKTPATEAGEPRPHDWASDLLIARALLDEKRGDPARAARGLDAALQKNPDNPRFLLVRAAIDERRGEWRAALKVADKILQADPRNIEALNFRGFVAVDHGDDLPKATRQLQVAMVLDPGAGGIVDSLGWAYLRGGDLARAADLLAQAERLEPGDPEILAHLAELYSRQKQFDRAVATYRRALAHDPDERVARDILKNLHALEPGGGAGR